MSTSEVGPIRMMTTVGVAGLISGLAVVGIFLVTKPRIERNRVEALEAAIFRVLEGAETRQAFVARGEGIAPYESSEGGLPDVEVVYAGYDAAGTLLGYAIPAEGAGFQDTIKLIYGYNSEKKRVVGMEVLESRETPGLGDKIIKDDHFVGTFRNLAVEPEIVLVKETPDRDNQVDAISGATISSRAVVKIINRSNSRWRDRLAMVAAPGPSGGGAQ